MNLESIYKCLLQTLIKKHKRSYANILGQRSINPLKGRFSFLYRWILNETKQFPQKYTYQLKQRIHWILNNLTDFPRCKNPQCHKSLDDPKYFKSFDAGYVEHCCIKCVNQDPAVRNQIKFTCIDRYNTNCSLYGAEAKKKSKTTIENHYGKNITNVFQAKEVIQQIKDTKIKNHGTPNYVNADKALETRHKKYNGKYESAETTEQRKNTFETRYGKGITNAGQTPAHKHMFDDPEKLKTAKKKERDTKKKNNSFAKSELEDRCYQLLSKVFNKVERQYTSDKYPFKCDFYVYDINTYIEINGYWTHGSHAFDSNNKNDIEIVKYWKSKNTPQYNAAIKNWTKTDVLKRTIAKVNKLNYLEFWNYNQFKIWIEQYTNNTKDNIIII